MQFKLSVDGHTCLGLGTHVLAVGWASRTLAPVKLRPCITYPWGIVFRSHLVVMRLERKNTGFIKGTIVNGFY